MKEAAIRTEELTKQYKGLTAVSRLNLTVEKGELFALLGVNGAGKTTAIKMLSGLIKPTSGDAVLLGDSVVSSPGKVKEKINVSPQETAVAPNLTVVENLRLVCGIYGHDKESAKQKAKEMIERFGMEEIQTQRAKTLSGGWQRRLSIAMALISNPRILFLDEPTLGLDVLARRDLWNVIKALKGEITIILTTHYLEEAENLSDHIGILTRGRLAAFGTARELMEQSGQDSFEEAFVTLCREGEKKQ